MIRVRFTRVATCRPPENGYTLPPEPQRAFPAKGGGIIGQQIKKLGFEIALVGHLKSIGVPVTDILENIEAQHLLPEDRLRRLAAYAVNVTGDDLLGLRLGRNLGRLHPAMRRWVMNLLALAHSDEDYVGECHLP